MAELTPEEQRLRELAESSADVWGEPVGVCRNVLELLSTILAERKRAERAERENYRQLVSLLDGLLACYRLGKHPSGKALDAIKKLRSKLEESGDAGGSE